jgi:DNA repair photolyase
MNRGIPARRDALALVDRVDLKFRPAWTGRAAQGQAALALYFLPFDSTEATLAPTRPRIIKWHSPWPDQAATPAGHRYCIDVFSGCAHGCKYCHANGRAKNVASGHDDFHAMIQEDIDDLERLGVPPAPVLLCNGTDPFQPLESRTGHTKFALEQILAHRSRFSSVTVTTKNPMLALHGDYLELFRRLAELPPDHSAAPMFRDRGLPAFRLQVSLPFWRDEARAAYEPDAPAVEDRKEAIRALCDAGVPLVLRIDPLFPRSPLTGCAGTTYVDFGLVEPQTAEDIEGLVGFARDIGADHVVHSPAKIVLPLDRPLSPLMDAMWRAYECAAAPDKLVLRNGGWRLPDSAEPAKVTGPFLDVCSRFGVFAKHHILDMIQTP